MTSLEVENSIFSSALRSIPPAPSAIMSMMIWLNWAKCTVLMINWKLAGWRWRAVGNGNGNFGGPGKTSDLQRA